MDHQHKLTPSESTAALTGLTILADGIDPVLDIVAIHGLNGHPQKTWTVNDTNWLRDLLPSDIPNARILSWGYDANTHSASPISAQYLYDHATTLVSDLCLERRLTKTQYRPIIFVAHSLGGIVVKSALIHSDAARKGALEEHQWIKLSTHGIFFMGTPHQGGNGVYFGETMLKVASIFIKADNKILKHLERDLEWLQQQLGQYAPVSSDFVTKFAYETLPTPTVIGQSIMVVPKASAVVPSAADAEPVAIPANHLDMVKFASREDRGYRTVSGHLQIMAEEAPTVISTRWEERHRIAEAQTNTEDRFSIPFNLSAVPAIEQIVGRKEELIKIKNLFQDDKPQRKVVLLYGLGGIGKTQLAARFVREEKEKYSAILWMNGKNQEALEASFVGIARRLFEEYPSSALLRNAIETKDVDQTIHSIKKWLSTRGNTRWILVVDNVDNPKLRGIQDPQAYDVKSYLPEADQGSVLITTRSSQLNIGSVIPVDRLQDTRECIRILTCMSGRSITENDSSVIELLAKLDGLPLAIATAGAYLSQVTTTFKDYLEYYKTSWLRLQQSSPQLPSYDCALYTTWNLSFEHIQRQNASAAKLLQLWAYFNNQDIWFELLAAGSRGSPTWFSAIVNDEISFNQTIRLLCDHALIQPLDVSGGYSMHSCVHAWTVHVLSYEKKDSSMRLALNCVGFGIPDRNVAEFWTAQQRLLPHALACSVSIQKDLDPASQDRDQDLAAIYNLGNLYTDQCKMAEAEKMYLRALNGFEKVWGPEHKTAVDTVNNLAILYSNQGRLAEAEKLFQRALDGKEKTWGPEHISTLNTVTSDARPIALA
ncbi:hypothetical protein MMC28_003846 [Mycoblastus sanguinarius]|nr:hypothetical protein [Mycoblastus sanguinarius]